MFCWTKITSFSLTIISEISSIFMKSRITLLISLSEMINHTSYYYSAWFVFQIHFKNCKKNLKKFANWKKSQSFFDLILIDCLNFKRDHKKKRILYFRMYVKIWKYQNRKKIYDWFYLCHLKSYLFNSKKSI